MYVKEIRVTNFQSYYGSDNHMAFSEGLNVVVGSINKGKSKLFDAFYWVLFGKIFITGEQWVNTNSLTPRASFVNDRARFLTQPGDLVDVRVELVICHQESDELPTDYTFCRTTSAQRLDNDFAWHDDRAWQVNNSETELRYQKGMNLEIVDNQFNIDEHLRRLFPREIRDYVWFQGEALDKLIDFSDRTSFEKAIKYISYFPRYETLSELIEQATDIIEKERNKKQRAVTANKKDYDDVVARLDQKKLELKREIRELAELEEQQTAASQAQEQAELRLKALQEFPPLQNRKAKAEAELMAAKNRIDHETDEEKKQFQKVWLLKGMSGLMQQAKQRMDDYETQRNSNAKYVLPDAVPGKYYMEKMLTEGQCLVCGTDAPAGSAPHQHIQSRIDAQDDYYRQQTDNQELYSSVQRLMSFPDEVIATVSGIDDQINETEDRIDDARKKRHEANETVLNVQAELDSLARKHQISDSSQATTQINKFTATSRALSDLVVRIERKKQTVGRCETEIKLAETKLNVSGTGGTADIPETRWHELASFMTGVVKGVKERAKVNMISLIEQRANVFYSNITKHNRAVDGKISIDKTTYRITRTENDEYDINSGNTGNFTLMKMCIINAMLALNEEVANESYPFIADAPTSNLDDETTIAYLKSLVSAFGQSIIITKDISQFRFAEVRNDPSVSTIHQLETHSDNPDAERFTQYEAYTKIKRIK